MSKIAAFDSAGRKRVIAAVRRVEAIPLGMEGAGYGTPVHEPPIRDAKITAVTAINGGIRWVYTIRLGHWDMTTAAAAGGTWVEDMAKDFTAFNSAEDMNTFTSGTGTIGTGSVSVAQADGSIGSTSCKLKSLPVGAYVTIKPRGADGNGVMHFTIVNAMNSAQ